MAVYKYSALNDTGVMVKGTYQATDKTTVISMIKSRGQIPLEVKEKGIINLEKFESKNKKVSSRDIAIFCRQFSTVIEAGIPILECLDIIRKQTESKQLKVILNRVYEQVQKGRTMSESLKEFKDILPSVLINMIESGESSGTLDKVMSRLAVYFANEGSMISKVKGALMYPAAILCVTIIAVMVLLTFVVPNFVGMYGDLGAELPLPTKILMSAGDFMGKWWFLIIGVIAGGVIGIVRYRKTENGKKFFDELLFKIPVISNLQVKLISARFTRTMASLMGAGLPLIQSLEITDKVINNTVVSKHLTEVVEEVSKGTKLSTAISNVGFFPMMVFNMINIGEESGSLDSILDKTADFYEEETSVTIESAMKLIEPVIIIFMAVIVGGVVIAMVLPMFGMMENIQNMQ